MITIKKILKKIGIDKSIAYTSAARIIQAGGGVISALFIAKFLTGVEQGFYYTFGSILAIQVFFELGLNGIITQYVAHEVSHLQWIGCELEGEEKYKSRLSSLLHFSIKWYSAFAFILFIALLLVGFIFFTRYDKTNGYVSWKIPWLVLSISTSINLIIAPLFSFLEGLGMVKEVARYRFFQQLFGLFIVWLSLIFGGKLLTAGINSLVWAFVAVIAFGFGPFGRILIGILRVKVVERVSYKKEIFPYQWKIALSWISGYFIFQLFNPVLFATDGAIVAGQMGMTLAALNGILSLSFSWTATKIPKYSGLIELRKFDQLDALFYKTTNQGGIINGVCLFILCFMIFVIRMYHINIGSLYLGNRFLDYFPLFMMVIPMFVNQYLWAWATYLRCHKKEPFLYNSIVGGVLCCFSTFGLGHLYGVRGITFGYCIISIFLTVWGYYIFKKKKIEWHESVIDNSNTNI
jgi:O-antigen/teichoic acid export membrane protein